MRDFIEWGGGGRNFAPAVTKTAASHDQRLQPPQQYSVSVVHQTVSMMAQSANRLTRTYLLSDPDFLLDYMAGIASDDSDDEFGGYLLSDDEPEGTVANK